MHAKPADIAKYKGRYSQGWDELRASRHQRMIEMGLVDPSWKMTPRDARAKAWKDAEMKAWSQRRMEVYAAMVDSMDQGIGRIIQQLEDSNYLDNTLILFLADNGGCAEEYGSNRIAKPEDLAPRKAASGPMRSGELQTAMIPRKTRDGLVVRTGRGVEPGAADTYIAYGKEWANASNTPFRLYKHWVHEGGISSPLIVHWPRAIASASRNSFVHDPAHLIDLMATCVDVGQATYPTEVEGKTITPMQGISLQPTMKGEPLQRKQPIFWEHEGNRAIREGQWKLVAKGPRGKWELYDLQADRTELHDLSTQHPQRVQAMAERWESWALDAKAKPWPWGPQKNKS